MFSFNKDPPDNKQDNSVDEVESISNYSPVSVKKKLETAIELNVNVEKESIKLAKY